MYTDTDIPTESSRGFADYPSRLDSLVRALAGISILITAWTIAILIVI